MRPSSSSSSSRSPGRRIVVTLSSYHPSRPLCSRRRIVFCRPPRGARDHLIRRLIQKSPSYACAGRGMRFLPRFTARSSPITITPTRRNAPRLERGAATATTTMTVARGGGGDILDGGGAVRTEEEDGDGGEDDGGEGGARVDPPARERPAVSSACGTHVSVCRPTSSSSIIDNSSPYLISLTFARSLISDEKNIDNSFPSGISGRELAM